MGFQTEPSDQIDIIIFDPQYTPTLLDQQSHRFVPAEAVYAVLEAKPSINKQYLDYAANKAASVRRLERTSVPIRHAGGEHPAKALFPIIAGIVAADVEWADGCASTSLIETLGALTGEREINLGIALSDCAFQIKEDRLHFTEKEGSLAAFLFLLLGRLQALGTVPAVDWERYGAVLSGNA